MSGPRSVSVYLRWGKRHPFVQVGGLAVGPGDPPLAGDAIVAWRDQSFFQLLRRPFHARDAVPGELLTIHDVRIAYVELRGSNVPPAGVPEARVSDRLSL